MTYDGTANYQLTRSNVEPATVIAITITLPFIEWRSSVDQRLPDIGCCGCIATAAYIRRPGSGVV